MTHHPIQATQAPTRIQQNVLARAERRVLNWLCARLPAWVTPDQLTILGFLGAVLVAAGYMLSWIDDEWLGLSLAGYLVNWFGDSLDGSLRSEEHTSELQSLMRISYAVFCLKKNTHNSVTTILLTLNLTL